MTTFEFEYDLDTDETAQLIGVFIKRKGIKQEPKYNFLTWMVESAMTVIPFWYFVLQFLAKLISEGTIVWILIPVIVFFAYVSYSFTKQSYRQVLVLLGRRMEPHKPMTGLHCGPTKITIGPDGIDLSRALVHETIGWLGITEIFEQQGHIFFLSGSRLMTIFPAIEEIRTILNTAKFDETANPWADKNGDIRTWKNPVFTN